MKESYLELGSNFARQFQNKLALRRPLRQSWRLEVFFGSHVSALIIFSNHSKTSFNIFIIIQKWISYIWNHLFGYILEYLAKFEVWSGIEKTRDSSFYVITYHKDNYFRWKSIINIYYSEFDVLSSVEQTRESTHDIIHAP